MLICRLPASVTLRNGAPVPQLLFGHIKWINAAILWENIDLYQLLNKRKYDNLFCISTMLAMRAKF
uniref:Uncharacterized protein n=1 Tax=Anguilla anguilla TaxID=7936 RepID=A0A0E9XN09_ANGAN